MTQPARTKTWQRIIDCTIGVILILIGVGEFIRFVHHPLHHPWAGYVWASLLAGTGSAVAIGAILRTARFGQRQSAGFQFELGGWGGSAFLVAFYAVAGFSHDHNLSLLEALILIAVMLFGSWLRLVAAMRDVIKGRT